MPPPRRIALVSLHTSPLDPPGSGDAGGMNVYVAELARQLTSAGCHVDVFTRTAGHPDDVPVVIDGGGRVVGITAPGVATAAKEDLPEHLPALAGDLLLQAARLAPPGRRARPYDVVHAHYWLSGELALTAAAAWRVPSLLTLHTSAAAKNAATDAAASGAAAGDRPEPDRRLAAERRLVATVDGLVVSTADEAHDLVAQYAADASRISVVPPGVDTGLFTPLATGRTGPGEPESRDRLRHGLGLPAGAFVVLAVGRVQPHKGPDLLVEAVAHLVSGRPDLATVLRLVVLGGESGQAPAGFVTRRARDLGVSNLVLRHGPVPREQLREWYRAADVVAVASRHESFGLVALEAQACGVPVIASRAGGLPEAVDDGVSGVLVDPRTPAAWAAALTRLIDDPQERRRLGAAGPAHAGRFTWHATAAGTLAAYERAIAASAPPSPPTPAPDVRARLSRWLSDSGVEHADGTRPGEVVAVLPGERRLRTTVSMLVGGHSVSVSAFVCRRPEDDAPGVHAWLLARNARLPGVAFAVDRSGDIHLVGRVPLAALAGPDWREVLDDLLGAVLQTVEDSFDEIVARGFARAIRAEHAWRTARGLPTDNLAAYRGVIEDRDGRVAP